MAWSMGLRAHALPAWAGSLRRQDVPTPEYSLEPSITSKSKISKASNFSKLLLEALSLHVAGERLSAGDMRDTAGIISHRTKLVSSIRPASLGAPKLFGYGRQERNIRCVVALRTIERSGHVWLSAHLHMLLAFHILIIMIRLTYLMRVVCSLTSTPHLK